MQIKFDYKNILSSAIGKEHGLTEEEILSFESQVNSIMPLIKDRKVAGSDFLGFLDLPYQKEKDIDPIVITANRLAEISDIHVVLGIGGSYLGAQALISSLLPTYYNELSRAKRNNRPRIYFEGNNLDPDALSSLFNLLPDTKPETLNEKFSLNVISKSGTTMETAVAFRLFRNLLKKVYGSDHKNYVVATTDKSRGKLKPLADKEGYSTFVIPDDVGGRYSIFTPVGLLPAAVCGINIHELLEGARDMAQRCQTTSLLENPAYLYAVIQNLFYKKNKNISIQIAWAKGLEFVGYWYDQLSAESLGKDEKGRVPITAVNTRDLHSRGQQLQDGERNIAITNIVVQNFKNDIVIGSDDEDMDGLNYLQGKKVSDILNAAREGATMAYTEVSRPSMDFILPQITPFTLGQLFYMLEISTIMEGYLMGINPLNQPGVESYKKFMKERLA